MTTKVGRLQVELALQELGRQLKEAHLYALRYGKGWDKVAELQMRHRQYALAVEELRKGQHAEAEVAVPRAA